MEPIRRSIQVLSHRYPAWQIVYRRMLPWLLPAYLLVSPFSDRSATFFLILLTLASLPFVLSRNALGGLKPDRLTVMLLLPLAALALSPLWAVNPGIALIRFAGMAGFTLMGLIAIVAIRRQPTGFAFPVPALLLVVVAALVLLAVFADPGLVGKTSASELNRAAISFMITYWILMIRFVAVPPPRERAMLIAAMAACIAVVLMSDTQSAVIGLALGHVAFGLSWFAPRLSFHMLSVGTIALLLFVRPIVAFLSSPALESLLSSSFMRRGSASIRLNIWQDYLEMSMDRFWFGYGPGTAASFEVKQKLAAQNGHTLKAYLEFVHPHNAFVQVWYDLGAFGALLVAVALAGFFMWMRPQFTSKPALVALVVAALSVAAISHGLYQSWWIALLVIAMAYAVVMGRADAPPRS